MRYTPEDPRSVKGPGLIRRVVGGKHRGKHSAFRPSPPSPPDVVDLGSGSEELALARIERLEKGTRLLAETMKATYGRLSAAVEDARRQAARGASVDQVHRMLSQMAAIASGPKPRHERVLPVLPLGHEHAEEGPDPLTALRRHRFTDELESAPDGEA